jgi:hypothetical protein
MPAALSTALGSPPTRALDGCEIHTVLQLLLLGFDFAANAVVFRGG